jgi:hypothetical protein
MNVARYLLAAVLFAAVVTPAWGQSPPPPSPSPADRIATLRYSLSLSDGKLGGSGAAVLQQATRGAHFVMVGEDHGTAEIPRFCDALFASLVPFGFRTAAVETGPLAATQIAHWIASPQGEREFSAFERKYPGTTAFYSWSGEYAFLRSAYIATGGTLRVWGIDQELMGSPGYILTLILATNPGPRSTQLARELLAANDADYAVASTSGSPEDTFLMKAAPEKLTALETSLATDGNPRARSLAKSLVDTYRIYIDCCNERAAQSNRARALLMKQTLTSYLRADSPGGVPPPKIFFKFGEEHMYRGFNVIRNNDVGNMVSELADSLGVSDVHVLVLGAKGSQTAFAGIGKPWRTATYDLQDDDHARFHYLAPFVAQMDPGGTTLYDLRPLRTHFASMGIADRDYERLVYGYDFLVLIANTTPDPAIDPTVF